MIRQYDAQNLCDIELRRHKLWDTGWRTNFTKNTEYIAACYHDAKRIVISVPALNARSEAELRSTILHEIAHAIVGHGHGHDEVWKAKCIELGGDSRVCAKVNFDAGRALNAAEMKKSPKIKAIQNTCPVCFKTAIIQSQAKFGDKLWYKLECGHLVKSDTIAGVDVTKWTNIRGDKTIYPYQAQGIQFIAEANGRALIADEPGLGKTIQALGALKFYPEMRPALWVCKSTLKIQALKEAIDWGGFELMGQIIEHKKMFIIPGMNLYIVSMDLLRNIPTEKLEEIPFKTVIADEIQHFKNPDSSRTAELRKLVSRAEYFIPLSGTPWKNRASEYFPVLNMLQPGLFPSPKHFRNKWIEYVEDRKTGKIKEAGIRDIPAFRELTKSFIIRRMRDDVLPDLPKINRNVRFVDMDEMYAKAYEKQEDKVAGMIRAALLEGRSMKDIGAMIMQLKHITGLAKVKVMIEDTVEWLENSPNDAEKITLFHHHIDVGDNIQQGDGVYEGLDSTLTNLGYNKTLRLFGGKRPEERDYIINSFKDRIENRILVASTLASGEGLNIQFCQNAGMLERQWNPANEEQAELRFSRPLNYNDYPRYLQDYLFNDDKEPKKVSIRVPYYIAINTVDEILTNIVEFKRHNFRKTMNDKDAEIKWDENEIINEVAQYIVKKKYGKNS